MSLELYTPDFSNRYEIAHSISVQMSVYYNDVGKLNLTLPISDYNIAAIKNDSILYDTKKKYAFIIKNIKTDTTQNRITVNGYTTNHLLESRVIAAPTAITNVESGIYGVVNDNLREMPRVSTAAIKGLTEEMQINLYGETVLEQIMPVLTSVELGQRMLWNHRTKEHVFEIYKGNDLTNGIHAVGFSEEHGTARNLVIKDDISTFKNVAYVTSTFKSGDTEKECVEIVGTATGADRHEMWSAITLSAEENETEAQFRARMRTQGALELEKLIKQKSFSVVIDPAEFGVLYNLGDLVSCVSKRFGVRFNARISGMKYRSDANGESTEIILGEPQLTAIGEVNLSD